MPLIDQLPPISYLITDSRFISRAQESCFFAIKGKRHDGHSYIQELYDKGVRLFVVEKHWATKDKIQEFAEDALFFVVENAIQKLQEVAEEKRKVFSNPVVGITGSNGKTIVKEWINALVEDELVVCRSPRSYNSQIGVPLSVWPLGNSFDVGIFEAGISEPNEMAALERILLPDIGIFTNIGTAHDVGFRSRRQKITEKLRLFKRSQVLIYCKDYEDLDMEIRMFLKAVNPAIELIAWTFKETNDPNYIQKNEKEGTVTIQIRGTTYRLPFSDPASVENLVHAIFCTSLLASKTKKEIAIQAGLNRLRPVSMRLELKEGSRDCYIIDDTYNNDLGGLQMALNFMDQQHTSREKVLILSDVLQSGMAEKDLYKQVKDLAKLHGIKKLIAVGESSIRNADLLGEALIFPHTEALLQSSALEKLHSALVLVKGARTFSFERVVNRLQHKVHGTVFEINLDAVTHNLNFYRNRIGQGTKIMAMVKASAYGSGSGELASLLQYHRVDYLGVAYTNEGVELRENGINLPIMVLNPLPETYQQLLDYRLEPEIYSLHHLDSFIQFLNRSNPLKSIAIHLKIDTGMHRLGFELEDLLPAINSIKASQDIYVASVFSHLAAADDPTHKEFTRKQINTFNQAKEVLDAGLLQKPIYHLANTAGILQYPEAKFDMVRLGIGLYGVESSGEEQPHLEQVGTLRTTISQIKKVNAGETVGYSRKGLVQRNSRIATIGIGYADGYSRRFSNGVGKVAIHGQLCPVIGNVCMDMTMVDVTDISCKEGDEVIVFGKNPSIFTLAEQLGTIPYEVLTSVSSRVRRVFYKA